MSISLVPGFAQRYPRTDDDEAYWRAFARHAGLAPDRHAGLAPARHAGPAPDRHAGLDPASLTLESCCTTLAEALSAEARGAGRIELCIDLSVGGITPPRQLIRSVVDRLSIPVNILVRDAACLDFVHDEAALNRMESDIAFCRQSGAAGVVVGALTPDGLIDLPAMRRLMDAAGPLSVTFHRAFDVCREDPLEAVDKLIGLLCTRLLTSGMAPSAWEGRELIARLVRHAGERLIIMPGRGVRPDNLAALAAATAAREFHGTAIP